MSGTKGIGGEQQARLLRCVLDISLTRSHPHQFAKTREVVEGVAVDAVVGGARGERHVRTTVVEPSGLTLSRASVMLGNLWKVGLLDRTRFPAVLGCGAHYGWFLSRTGRRVVSAYEWAFRWVDQPNCGHDREGFEAVKQALALAPEFGKQAHLLIGLHRRGEQERQDPTLGYVALSGPACEGCWLCEDDNTQEGGE